MGLLLAGDRHIPDVLDGHVPLEAVYLLVDVHHHQAIRVDQGRHIQAHADLQLLDGGIAAVSAAAIVAGGRVGPRFAHEDAGWLIVRGLDAGSLEDLGPRVAGRG